MADLHLMMIRMDQARKSLATASDRIPEKELLAMIASTIAAAESLPENPELTEEEKRDFTENLRIFPPVLELGIKGEWPALKPIVLEMLATVIDRIFSTLGNAILMNQTEDETDVTE